MARHVRPLCVRAHTCVRVCVPVVPRKPKRGHQHAPKDAKTKRNKRKAIVVSGTWAYLLKRMMGGG